MVTGLGSVNPLGCSVRSSFERLVRGESGFAELTQDEAPDRVPHGERQPERVPRRSGAGRRAEELPLRRLEDKRTGL